MPRGVRLFRFLSSLALASGVLALAACAMPGGGDRALEAAFPRRSIELSNAGLVSWFESGDPAGTPVVYIHGTPGSAGSWASYLLSPVSWSWSVALDRPGFGASSPGTSMPELRDQAWALQAVLDAASREHARAAPVLVGHSLGAPIAAWYAAEHPEGVSALVLLGGSMDPALEQIHPLQRLADLPPLSWLLPDVLRVANEELLPLESELEALASILDQVTCPVVIVHGTDDGLVPYANVAFMERAFTSTDVEVLTLPGEGHFLPWEHEGLVRAVIESAIGHARADRRSAPGR